MDSRSRRLRNATEVGQSGQDVPAPASAAGSSSQLLPADQITRSANLFAIPAVREKQHIDFETQLHFFIVNQNEWTLASIWVQVLGVLACPTGVAFAFVSYGC